MSEVITKFKELMSERRLWPPLNNYSFFGQGSSFNTLKYFKEYYPDLPPLHLLIIARDGDSMQMLPADTLEYCSRYIFRLYLEGSNQAQKRFFDFDEIEKRIDLLYQGYSEEKVRNTPVNNLLSEIDRIRDDVWGLNSFILFTLYFDKEICLDVLAETNSRISKERLNEIWDRATRPAFESFEKAQQRSVLKNIMDDQSQEFLIENARYIYTNYFGSISLDQVSVKYNEEFGAVGKDEALSRLGRLDEAL